MPWSKFSIKASQCPLKVFLDTGNPKLIHTLEGVVKIGGVMFPLPTFLPVIDLYNCFKVSFVSAFNLQPRSTSTTVQFGVTVGKFPYANDIDRIIDRILTE